MRAAELLVDELGERLDLGSTRHVELHCHGAHAALFHLRERVGGLGDVAERDVHAFVGERERHGASEAARRAGDCRHFASQLAHLPSTG